MTKYQLFLESIQQARAVGKDLSFRITSPSGLNKSVGPDARRRALTAPTEFEHSFTMGLAIAATERDRKYSDFGKAAGFIYVQFDAPTSGTSISVLVKEDSGPRRKTSRTATFTLNFVAEVQQEKQPEKTQLSAEGLKFLTDHEGLRLTQYEDGAKYPTIDYGHKIDPKKEPELMGATITREKANELFRRDLGTTEADVARLVKVPLTTRKRDALVSLVYNIGGSRFAGSALRKAINGNAGQAAISKEWAEFRLARDAKTRKLIPLPGLEDRRKAEIVLFFSGGR